MAKISQYLSDAESLAKVFCSLAEKSYLTGNISHVIAPTESYANSLDQILWTFSQKKFIPHALVTDPNPEKQPILISYENNFPLNANILILVNLDQNQLNNILSHDTQKYERVIIISDLSQKYHFSTTVSEIFEQNQGRWQKIPNKK